jgi:hypothetical protein
VRSANASGLADAFANTFALSIVMCALAIVPIALLAWTTRNRAGEYAEPHVGPEHAPAPVHGGT